MTKLALVLGGHASLGAYTAGAASEILRALDESRRSDTSVAVVTGSGTGGLTAALAARSLVVNPGLRPWIERLWLDALDARHLLNPDRPDRTSLLDPAPLEELTLHMIAGDAAEDDRPSPALAGRLGLGLSLVPYRDGVDAAGDGPLRGGAATFDLEAGRGADDPVWEHVRRAALACAAVPAALPPRRLGPEDGVGGEGWYVGAGAARPRPLALARELARRGAGEPGGEWHVVVVDPDPGAGAPDGPAGGRGADGGSPAGTAREAASLLRAALGTDVAGDWRDARDAGERLELLRSLARRLPEIHGRLDDPDAVGLGRHIGRLAEEVAEREARRRGPTQEETGDPVLRRLDADLGRIQAHPAYEPAFRELGSRAGRTRLAKLVYVLEAASGLLGEDASRLVRISPPERGELAGRGLAGFAGFASRSWRRHDLVAGRRDALRALEGPLEGLVDGEPRDPEAYRPGAVRGVSAAMSPEERTRLRDRLGMEADRALDGVAPGGWRGLLFRLARPAVRARLVDRALDAADPTAG